MYYILDFVILLTKICILLSMHLELGSLITGKPVSRQFLDKNVHVGQSRKEMACVTKVSGHARKPRDVTGLVRLDRSNMFPTNQATALLSVNSEGTVS